MRRLFPLLFLSAAPASAQLALSQSPTFQALGSRVAAVEGNNPVYPIGARCRGLASDATADLAAFQAAANTAIATGRALHLGGGGVCVLNGSITVSGAMTIIGDGPGASIMATIANAPIIDWTVGSAEVDGALVAGVTFRGQFAAGATYSSSNAIRVRGTAGQFFQHNVFRNIVTEGLYAAFDIDAGTFSDSFGLENYAAWNTFDNVTVLSGARPAVYGWHYPSGSGTGNVFIGTKTNMGDTSGAVYRFEGAGAVVGDIVSVGGHYGGVAGAKVMSIGTGTVYRQNIAIIASQADAGATQPLDLPSDAPAPSNVHFEANNVGGAATLVTPAISGSILHGYGVDERRLSKQVAGLASGAISVPLYSVDLSGLTYTGTRCIVTASGLVGGVSGGISARTLLIGRNASTLTVVDETPPASSTAASGFFAFAPSTSGTVVTIALTGTASATGSYADTQIDCSGGTYAVAGL